MVDSNFYKEFGELKGKVDGMGKQLDTVQSSVSSIDRKLDELGAVPYSVFNDHIELKDKQMSLIGKKIEKNAEDLRAIREHINLKENSLSGRVSTFFESAIVKLLGGGFVAVAIVVVGAQYIDQINALEKTIDSLKQNDKVIQTQVQTLENQEARKP